MLSGQVYSLLARAAAAAALTPDITKRFAPSLSTGAVRVRPRNIKSKFLPEAKVCDRPARSRVLINRYTQTEEKSKTSLPIPCRSSTIFFFSFSPFQNFSILPKFITSFYIVSRYDGLAFIRRSAAQRAPEELRTVKSERLILPWQGEVGRVRPPRR